MYTLTHPHMQSFACGFGSILPYAKDGSWTDTVQATSDAALYNL